MKKKIISMGLILFLLSGCWNYQEIQDFANVAGIAIDKGEEKKYKVSMEVISLDATTDFKPQTHVYESEDDTILGAGRSAISFVSKKLYYGHCKVIIISEELAREGISNLLDIFLRDHEFRITMLLFIAKGSSAKEMLEETAELSDVASYELEHMVRRHMIFSTFSKKQSLYRVIGKILEEGVAPVIPILELIQVSEDEKTFNLAGMACFRGDVFVNYLDVEETKYFLCLTDKYVAGFLTFELDSENFV